MASSGQTANYGLNLWGGGDKPIRTDFNSDNLKIDAAIKAVETSIIQFAILGRYDTLADLQTAQPTGQAGEAYAVGTALENEIYVWNVLSAVWLSIGSVHGSVGDVVGPVSATDDALALFDGISGKLIKSAALSVSGISGAISDITALEGRMGTAEGDIDDLETAMTTAQSDIDTAETNITALQAVDNTGWVPITGALAYVSATSLTLVGDYSAVLKKGDAIKWVQNGVAKESTVVLPLPSYNAGTGKTTVTIHAGYIASAGDCAVLNTTNYPATGVAFSHINTRWFYWTPVITGGNADLSGYTLARFCLANSLCHYKFYADNKSVSGSAGTILISMPVSNAFTENFELAFYYIASYTQIHAEITGGNLVLYKGMTFENWAANETGVFIRCKGAFEY